MHLSFDYVFICYAIKRKKYVKSACNQKPPLPNYREEAALCLPPAAAIVHFSQCGPQQGQLLQVTGFDLNLQSLKQVDQKSSKHCMCLDATSAHPGARWWFVVKVKVCCCD